MQEGNHPAFDKDEQTIISTIVPTGESVEEIAYLPEPPQPTTDAPAEAPAQAGQAAAADAAIPAPAPQPSQGDARAALRAARQSEKRLRAELDRKEQEIEALKSGRALPSSEISESDLAQMEQDFPVQAALIRRQRELEQQVQQLVAQRAPAEFQPPTYAPEIQEVIDTVPVLQAWQYDPDSQDKFRTAIAHDQMLEQHPEWKTKPVNVRFAEAARLAELDFATPSVAATTAPRPTPAQVIANAQVATPKSISDFRGGATANAPAANYYSMSDEAIMASLPME